MVIKIDHSSHSISGSPELEAQSSSIFFNHLENSTSNLAKTKAVWETQILKVSSNWD